ncbi:MAG: HEAT repeat domain-containing protein [archaeon]
MKKIILMVVMVLLIATGVVRGKSSGEKRKSVKDLFQELNIQKDNVQRKRIIKELDNTVPQTEEDVVQVRNIILLKVWDEEQFATAMNMTKKINKVKLDGTLIKILKDEKKTIEEMEKGKLTGKTEKEMMYRHKNIEFIIKKLGELKSKKSIGIIKEYLDINGMQFVASESLGMIGDKSASEKIRDKAYKGEEVNYGGLGLDEAKQVVQDLEDVKKKDKWSKIAKQIIMIKNPEAKPYLKELFNHEKDYVRQESAGAYCALVTDNDMEDIIKMSKNNDWFVRSRSIDAMKRLSTKTYEDVLINLLEKDPHRRVRANAAKALGYKKIINAIPYLEKSLKDIDYEVRKESFVALYILTGKKYDFAGRDSAIDQQAEWQKKHPTFH